MPDHSQQGQQAAGPDTFQPGDHAEEEIKRALRLADIILESNDPRTFIANMILHEKHLAERTRPGEATPPHKHMDQADEALWMLNTPNEATPQKQELLDFLEESDIPSFIRRKIQAEARADLPGEGMRSAESWISEWYAAKTFNKLSDWVRAIQADARRGTK